MTKRKTVLHQRNEVLVALRTARGWTQMDAAGACDVEPGTYQAWERGICRPNLDHLLQISQVFGVPAEKLGFELRPSHISALQARGEPSYDPAHT